MVGVLSVAWIVSSAHVFSVVRRCPRCDAPRRFVSSGKFRLNANGRRLDAWLIHRCAACGRVWNQSVIDRRSVADLPPPLLEALERNDVEAARACGLELPAGEGGGFSLRRRPGPTPQAPWSVVTIELDAPATCAARLDAVIAQGLQLSRSRVAALAAAGRLSVEPALKRALARPARPGAVVSIDLAGAVDADAICRAALDPSGAAGRDVS